MNRPCLVCGTPAPGTRCPEHSRQRERLRHNPIYDTPRWRRLARSVKARHLSRHGYMCPGWEVPRHLANRLSVDHIVSLVDGGEPYSEANVQILCVSCNARKGSRQNTPAVDTPGMTPR